MMLETLVNKVKIREALVSEIPIILQLIKQFEFKEDGSGSLLPLDEITVANLISNGSFFVAALDNKVIGCASVVEYDSIAEFRSLAVSREYQFKGIGTNLAEKCKEFALAKGYNKLYALTKTENCKFFEKRGFVHIEKPPQKMKKDCEKCLKYYNGRCDEDAMVFSFKGDFNDP